MYSPLLMYLRKLATVPGVALFVRSTGMAPLPVTKLTTVSPAATALSRKKSLRVSVLAAVVDSTWVDG